MRLIRKTNGWFIAGISVALWLVYDYMVIPMPFISDWWKDSFEYRYQMRRIGDQPPLNGKDEGCGVGTFGSAG